jgi:transaldolase
MGLTSNPAIFQAAISGSNAYDAQLAEVLATGADERETFFALAIEDVQAACDVLRSVFDATGGNDGFVSLEVDPGLAYDTAGTTRQALELAKRVDRPNLMVKIPATEAGLPAIEEAIARGISINVTLIFSLERYAAVVQAYIAGLERLVAAGGDPADLRSVASFFISRVDSEADRRLEAAGHGELAGKLGIANAKLAYRHFTETFAGPRWDALVARGAVAQRPLWASTSTKNPAYRDTMYVEELVGPETVNTMPTETIEAFEDHGVVRGNTVSEGWSEADELFAAIAAAGVDVVDVTRVLEDEGVKKFTDAFDALLEVIRTRRGAISPA